MERLLTPVTLVRDHNSSVVLLAVMASVEWVPKGASRQEIILGIERMLTSLTLGVRDNNSSMAVMVVMVSVELVPKEASMQGTRPCG